MNSRKLFFAAKPKDAPIVSGMAEVNVEANGQFFLRPLMTTNNIASVSVEDFGKVDTVCSDRPIVFAGSEEEAIAAMEAYLKG